MKNTTRYYEAVTSYRNEMRQLGKKYQEELERLAPHKGSEYYTAQEKKADDERAAQLEALRSKYSPVFDGIISDMEKTYKTKPAILPTQEQLALVQMLKIRDNVGSVDKVHHFPSRDQERHEKRRLSASGSVLYHPFEIQSGCGKETVVLRCL